MRVRCIEEKVGLTLGKVYDVIKEVDNKYYTIKNDMNHRVDIYKTRFEIVNDDALDEIINIEEEDKKSIWAHHKVKEVV